LLAADPKILQRLAPHLKRVLIVDANMASARLLADLLRDLGAVDIMFEPDERSALELAREIDPQLIFVERSGPRLQGENFTRKIRRSHYACRKAPIIMVTADSTAISITAARDCGVHEFLRKPFTAGDVFKRVAVVFLKSRDWVEAIAYVGPDRRRFNSGDYQGSMKRDADKPEFKAEADARAKDQALKILRAAIIQFDRDPNQAVRAIAAQVTILKRLSEENGEAEMAAALHGLEQALTGGAVRSTLLKPIQDVLDQAAAAPRPTEAGGEEGQAEFEPEAQRAS
jgi:DNA-binding response OmpR family regulator